MNIRQLTRIRWGVRTVLVLGVATSVAANVLHANPNPISQAIAAWPPLALLLTVELISRVPVHRRWLAAVRVLATVLISGIAAWVSYWHMAGVAARYGEIGAAPYLIPVSVDGLVVVASVCLVELAGRIRVTAPAAPVLPLVDPAPVTPAAATPVDVVPAALPAVPPAAEDDAGPVDPAPVPADLPPSKPARPARPRTSRRPPSADKVTKAAARMPGATIAQIAARAGVSESTARRYLPATARTASDPTGDATVASANGGSSAATPVLADAA